MKWQVSSTMQFPVITEVEAETEEEAIAISKQRLPTTSGDASQGWVLDERYFNNGSKARN